KNFEYTDIEGRNKQNYFNPGTPFGGNPYWILNRNLSEALTERMIALTSLRYELSDAVQIMIRGSYDGSNQGTEGKAYNDNYASAPDGAYSIGKNRSMEFNADFLGSFNKAISTDWNVNFNI